MKILNEDEKRNWLNEIKEVRYVEKIPKYGFTQKLLDEAEETFILGLYFSSLLCTTTSLTSLIYQKLGLIKKRAPGASEIINRAYNYNMINENLRDSLLDFQKLRNDIVHKKSPTSEYRKMFTYLDKTDSELFDLAEAQGIQHAFLPFYLARKALILYYEFCASWFNFIKEKQQIINELDLILKKPHQAGCTEFHVWLKGKWAIKKPQEYPPLANGRKTGEVVDLEKLVSNFERIEDLMLKKLNIPGVYNIKQYNVLLQKRIYGKILEDTNLFQKIKEEFNFKKDKAKLSSGYLVLKQRNIIQDNNGVCWLVDLD